VMDLARDLIRLAGRDPSSHPIETIGLRPGEKLHEELFYDIESVEPTESPKVRRAKSPVPPVDVRGDVRRMLDLATGGEEALLRTAILDYAWAHDEAPEAFDAPVVSPEWSHASTAIAAIQ
jgi:FlaA1/EpsC-like NDP-sugar epimerase